MGKMLNYAAAFNLDTVLLQRHGDCYGMMSYDDLLIDNVYFTDVQKQRTQSDIESIDSRSNTETGQ